MATAPTAPTTQGVAVDKEVNANTSSRDGSEHDSHTGHSKKRDLDDAFRYLQGAGAATGASAGADTATDDDLSYNALKRKIDWRIVPIMFACYTMQFIDKVSLNYAAVMGLNKDLALGGNDFSNAGSAFFIAYLIAEVPTGFLLQKVPAAKWLGANVVLWGIATACTAAATNYNSLLAARIFLGVFEAAIAPSLILISGQWYTKSEQAPRFSFWYCGLGLGQIIGGLVSYAFQKVDHPQFVGWRIMFVVLGCVTVVIGFLTAWILPDTPMKARFLSEAEKVAVLKHVSVNQTGIQNKNFKLSQVWEVLLDVQLWLMTLITILISISSGVVTTYSATLIKGFGFSSPVSALLNMPSGIVSITATLLVGFGVRKGSNRWAWIVFCCVPGILGGGLMSFAPSDNRAALLAGIYLVNSVVATLIVIYQWTSANCAGQTKRVVSIALISGSFSVGNIIGPQTFQVKDAPQYIPAKITVLATQAAGAVMAVVLFAYYVWANKRKDAKRASLQSQGVEVETEVSHWEGMTDKENISFRYVY
ncbi:MAG: hypothetical protein M1829_004807 [Trizodia sp. TS-e1964]|nr:MAG: hypothetical protein M1829_004807 [Trizodia sp. TS-e1964]